MNPVDVFMAKRLKPAAILKEFEYLPEWRWNDSDWVDHEGHAWGRMLGGWDPRVTSVDDAKDGKFVWPDQEGYYDCKFQLCLMRRLHDNFIANVLFQLRFYERPKYCSTTETVCDLVPCDYTGPDPVMRDVT